MRWVRSLAAGIAALVIAAGCAGTGPGRDPGTDARQRVALVPSLRDGVLTEMRAMLGSVSGVVQGLGVDDLAAAEQAARASGMAAAVDVDPRLRQALPPEFLQLGMQTHRSFDALADRIRAGAPRGEILQALAGLMANCVRCHATWRLDEAR